MELYFSYGILQFEKAQIKTFDRVLNGQNKTIKGYKLDTFKVINPEVSFLMNNDYHPIAIPSDNPEDEIIGTVFELTKEEIIKVETIALKYANYKKTKTTLDSGEDCWILHH